MMQPLNKELVINQKEEPSMQRFSSHKIIFTGLLMLGLMTAMTAQDYKGGVKIKFGRYFGISYKYLAENEKGFEGIFHIASDGANLTGLRIIHTPAFPTKSSRWFLAYGYGAHLTYYNTIKQNDPFKPFSPPIIYKGHFISAGMDGLLSMEYRFLRHPFVVSADYIPNFEFFGPGFFRVNLDNIAFTFAYVF